MHAIIKVRKGDLVVKSGILVDKIPSSSTMKKSGGEKREPIMAWWIVGLDDVNAIGLMG